MRRSGSLNPLNRGKTLEQAFDAAMRMQRESLFLFLDLQQWLGDAETQRRILDLARHFDGDRRTIVLSGPDIELPPALRAVCATWDMPHPSADELHKLARRVIHDSASGPPPCSQSTPSPSTSSLR